MATIQPDTKITLGDSFVISVADKIALSKYHITTECTNLISANTALENELQGALKTCFSGVAANMQGKINYVCMQLAAVTDEMNVFSAEIVADDAEAATLTEVEYNG